jgi:hypothetical protein
LSEVTDALDALAAGERDLDDVAAQFTARAWPPEPHVPGSFTEVADAYSHGHITLDQYTRLALAAAESHQQPRQEEP